MREFRNRSLQVLRQVEKGHSIVLTHRGRPVARLEPICQERIRADDPIYGLPDVASDALAPLTNAEIDAAVYGEQPCRD
jgi:antitoxin (DNA-binding transcriptional repressor) of toxin-antitoxin stability system